MDDVAGSGAGAGADAGADAGAATGAGADAGTAGAGAATGAGVLVGTTTGLDVLVFEVLAVLGNVFLSSRFSISIMPQMTNKIPTIIRIIPIIKNISTFFLIQYDDGKDQVPAELMEFPTQVRSLTPL